MRKIEQTGQFRRDYKREKKGQHRATIDDDFTAVRTSLMNDNSLDTRHRDHPLTGEWKDHRDCYIKPDLVLIYSKPDDETLRLVRVGSHAELNYDCILPTVSLPVVSPPE